MSVIEEIMSAKLPTSDKKILLDQYRDECSRVESKVYEFFREHLKDDKTVIDMARNHYDGYLKNDTSYSCFEDWFKGCIYDMSGESWKEGVNEYLGQFKQNGLDQYLDSIKFKDFLDGLDYRCEVHFNYTDGQGMLVSPTAHIKVKLLNWI